MKLARSKPALVNNLAKRLEILKLPLLVDIGAEVLVPRLASLVEKYGDRYRLIVFQERTGTTKVNTNAVSVIQSRW